MRTCSQHFENFGTDALVIMDHFAQVIGNTFVDTCAANDPAIAAAAHRDAIQLIPPSIYLSREQFAAGSLVGVSVLGNRIESTGKLQGIFGSDGLFQNLRIIGNTVQTKSQHFISINGLLDGHIEGNIRPDGSYCPIFLGSARIGGNLGDGIVRILGFAGDSYRYAPIEEIVDWRALKAGVVVDVRTRPLLNKDTNLINFQADEFRAAAQKLPTQSDINAHMRALKQLALTFGDKL